MHIACENTYNSPEAARVTVKGTGVSTYEPVADPLKLTRRLWGSNPVHAKTETEVKLLQQTPSNLRNHRDEVHNYFLVHYVDEPNSPFYIAQSQLQQEYPQKPKWMTPPEGKPARHNIPGNTWLRQTADTTAGSLGLPAGSEVVISGESQMVTVGGGPTEFRKVQVFKAGSGTVKDSANRVMTNANKGALAGWQKARWARDLPPNRVSLSNSKKMRRLLNDWHKLGVKLVDGSSNEDGFLDKADTATDSEESQQKEASEFFSTLYDKLVTDRDNDSTLSGNDIKAALADEELAGKLRMLFIKHKSEWVKRDTWPRLEQELKNMPNLYKYVLQVTNKMIWIEEAAAVVGDTKPWFIHPAGMMGLVADPISDDEMDEKWLTVTKRQLTFDAEGNDVDTSIYFSRKPHIPMQRDGTVIGQSGITYGRGLDVGQQTQQFVSNLLSTISENARPLSDKMSSWLIVGSGKKRALAKVHLALINDLVPIDEQLLTRKQQHFLFLSVYADRESTTKRTIEAARGSRHVLAPPGKIIWDQLPTDVQEVLVYLTFRGDNHSKSRDSIIPALVEGLESSTLKFDE